MLAFSIVKVEAVPTIPPAVPYLAVEEIEPILSVYVIDVPSEAVPAIPPTLARPVTFPLLTALLIFEFSRHTMKITKEDVEVKLWER